MTVPINDCQEYRATKSFVRDARCASHVDSSDGQLLSDVVGQSQAPMHFPLAGRGSGARDSPVCANSSSRIVGTGGVTERLSPFDRAEAIKHEYDAIEHHHRCVRSDPLSPFERSALVVTASCLEFGQSVLRQARESDRSHSWASTCVRRGLPQGLGCAADRSHRQPTLLTRIAKARQLTGVRKGGESLCSI
jgi:hypothetical protein